MTAFPRVGSIELHTTHVIVRDAAGHVERIDLEVLARSVEVAIVALRTVARERWGPDAQVKRGQFVGGWGRYDVHAPVRAESARMAAQGGLA